MGKKQAVVSTSDLSRLESQLGAQQAAIRDPKLRDLMGEVELRAAVELAKLDRMKQAQLR